MQPQVSGDGKKEGLTAPETSEVRGDSRADSAGPQDEESEVSARPQEEESKQDDAVENEWAEFFASNGGLGH